MDIESDHAEHQQSEFINQAKGKKMPLIHSAMIQIMQAVEPITKGKTNSGQGYKFRGIDDAYLALHDIFARCGVVTIPRVIKDDSEERINKNGGVNIYRKLLVAYDFMASDGSVVTVGPIMGEGMDSGDKASNKALSVAHKYALLQTFMIPTEEPAQIDPETDSHEIQATNRQKLSALKQKHGKFLVEAVKNFGRTDHEWEEKDYIDCLDYLTKKGFK